jgi:hypothetical protein
MEIKPTNQGDIAVFYDSELPALSSHCNQAECGFSIYKSTLIRWDEDSDDVRILQFIDELANDIREELLVCQQHEGTVQFIWKSQVPQGYEKGCGVDVAGDGWYILESIAPEAVPA